MENAGANSPVGGSAGSTGGPLASPAAVTTAAVLGQPLAESWIGVLPPMRKLQVMAALSNSTRFRMVVELLDGRPRTITQLARVVRRDPDLISKHLQHLRAAGVLVVQQGVDRRCNFFYLPAAFRTTPGRLDFGCVSVAVE